MSGARPLHRCEDQSCPALGQRTSKSCGCHKTTEELLIAQRDELVELLEIAAERLASAEKDADLDFDPWPTPYERRLDSRIEKAIARTRGEQKEAGR